MSGPGEMHTYKVPTPIEHVIVDGVSIFRGGAIDGFRVESITKDGDRIAVTLVKTSKGTMTPVRVCATVELDVRDILTGMAQEIERELRLVIGEVER